MAIEKVQSYKEEHQKRCGDKLRYRYPGGESYLDVVERLKPILLELERTHDNMLLVTHKTVMRILIAYVMDMPSSEMINHPISLHTLYCVEPMPYGYLIKKWVWDESTGFTAVDI